MAKKVAKKTPAKPATRSKLAPKPRAKSKASSSLKRATKKSESRSDSRTAPHAAASRVRSISPREIADTREVFWQNVMRELLTSLAILTSKRSVKPSAAQAAPGGGPESGDGQKQSGATRVGSMAGLGNLGLGDDESDEEDDGTPNFDTPITVGTEPGNMFDGRLAVINSMGQRIPIAEIHPVFGCGVPGPDGANPLSMIVECSVFEIRTPGGEVYTLPIHEIKAFHALTPELVEEIGRAVGAEVGEDGDKPFGFAAFTSLARNQGVLSEVPVVEREWQGE